MILSFLTQTVGLSNTVPGYGINPDDFYFKPKNDVPEIEDSPLLAAGNLLSRDRKTEEFMVAVILVLISLFLLIFASTSLPYVIGSASVLSFILSGQEAFLAIFPQRMYSQINMFVLLALPMFVLTGEIMGRTKVAGVLIDFAMSVFGRFKGGLGHVNIVTSIFFAGVSGSQFADTAMLSNVLVPQMKKRGYPGAYAAAITATSSVVGPVIPPSTILILYGALLQLSIGALFIAGIIPGLLLGLMMMITNSIVAHRKNHPGGTTEDRPPFWPSLFRALPALSLPVIIVGGIVFGVVTPTEAGAISVLAALGCGYLYGGITWRSLIEGVEKTAVMVGAMRKHSSAVAELLAAFRSYIEDPVTMLV